MRQRAWLTGGIATVAVLVLVGAALATHNETGRFSACYAERNGTVRLIGEPGLPSTCPRGTVSFTFDQQGIPGPQGSPGPTSVLHYRTAREEVALTPTVGGEPTRAGASVQCLAGETLISGGWETDPIRPVLVAKAQIDRNGEDARPVSYAVIVFNTTTDGGVLRVHAVCVGPS